MSINELRTLPVGSNENPAEIRDIHLDGPSADNPQVLWFGTPSGLHQMRLIDDVISHSGLLENPFALTRLAPEISITLELYIQLESKLF